MVSFTAATLLTLAAAGAIAGPTHKRAVVQESDTNCMDANDAQQVANNYAELIRDYTETLANAALSVDFTDYSESVNSLIDSCPQGSAAISLPLLSPTFTNRTTFEAGQGQQAPINFKQLNIWNACNSVLIRWETTNTAPIPSPRPVIGMIAIEVSQAPSGSQYPWLIDTVFSEFDAAAWLQNLEEAGNICSVNPSSPPVALTGGQAPPTGSAGTSAAAPTTTPAPAR